MGGREVQDLGSARAGRPASRWPRSTGARRRRGGRRARRGRGEGDGLRTDAGPGRREGPAVIGRCHLSALLGKPEPPRPGGVLYQQDSKQCWSVAPGPCRGGGVRWGLEAWGLKDSPGETPLSSRKEVAPGPQTEAPQVGEALLPFPSGPSVC